MSTTINNHELHKTSGPLVCRGVKEICDAVGINHKRFKYYVEVLRLPAFKIDDDSNVWLATYEDLTRWVEERKKVYFGDK